MTNFEVPEPILNSPYEEPKEILEDHGGRNVSANSRSPSGKLLL